MTWSPMCRSHMLCQLKAQEQPGDQQRALGMPTEQGEPETHLLETQSEPMCALTICTWLLPARIQDCTQI